MSAQGVVFNIQRFSTHDGPGIRTTVFFKGCPLRCLWCSNPESQDPLPQLMTRDLKCTGCGACVEACPEQAISLTPETGRVIDWEKCTRCFACVHACLYQALTAAGALRSPEFVLEEVLKDKVFYRNSGGGVTASGGEALMQPDFLKELFALCKEAGLHTALDTTGFASPEVLESVLPLTDLVLFDIKLLDPERHRACTGVDNRRILDNARRAAAQTRVWFRMPLMAGINDSEQEISQAAGMARAWGVEKISLLPYHEGGLNKWAQVGLAPPDFMGRAPGADHLKRLTAIISQRGIQAAVGS